MEEGEALAKEYNVKFFECSAKQDIGVEKAFLSIATDVKNRLTSDANGPKHTDTHKITNNKTEKSGGCC